MVDRDDRWPVVAARAADEKQGLDTIALDVGDVLAITGYFVITSATNTRQVRTIAEWIQERIVEGGGPKPLRTEGQDERTWVLLDYGDFVVHVFLQETREYYELERLWSDVPRVEWRSDPL
ncbi:MAG: ribosome silencing factor [Acidimicrobiales bacterium]